MQKKKKKNPNTRTVITISRLRRDILSVLLDEKSLLRRKFINQDVISFSLLQFCQFSRFFYSSRNHCYRTVIVVLFNDKIIKANIVENYSKIVVDI